MRRRPKTILNLISEFFFAAIVGLDTPVLDLHIKPGPIYCKIRASPKRMQPGQRKRQMRSPLIIGDGVDLIDDNGASLLQFLLLPYERG